MSRADNPRDDPGFWGYPSDLTVNLDTRERTGDWERVGPARWWVTAWLVLLVLVLLPRELLRSRWEQYRGQIEVDRKAEP